jgi:flavodoxin
MNYKRDWNVSFMAAFVAATSLGCWGCSTSGIDAVTTATKTVSPSARGNNDEAPGRALMILASAPGGSTAKIARAMAAVLGARVLSPAEATSADLSACAIAGFGSGIIDQQHHAALLSFVDALPPQAGKKAFIFSTSGISRQVVLTHGIDDPHTVLRQKLVEKGFIVAGEYNCAGFNANSFLKLFGGMNKGRPNQADLARAEDFARGLMPAEVTKAASAGVAP